MKNYKENIERSGLSDEEKYNLLKKHNLNMYNYKNEKIENYKDFNDSYTISEFVVEVIRQLDKEIDTLRDWIRV